MLINKTSLTIDEKIYELEVNVGSMINAERLSGTQFMSLVAEAEKGSVQNISYLLARCLKENGQPVGMKFIENMDFGTFEQLFDPLFDLIIKSFPTSDTKKNVVVVETRKIGIGYIMFANTFYICLKKKYIKMI